MTTSGKVIKEIYFYIVIMWADFFFFFGLMWCDTQCIKPYCLMLDIHDFLLRVLRCWFTPAWLNLHMMCSEWAEGFSHLLSVSALVLFFQTRQPSLPWHSGSTGGGPRLPETSSHLLPNPPVSEDHSAQNAGGGAWVNIHCRIHSCSHLKHNYMKP